MLSSGATQPPGSDLGFDLGLGRFRQLPPQALALHVFAHLEQIKGEAEPPRRG